MDSPSTTAAATITTTAATTTTIASTTVTTTPATRPFTNLPPSRPITSLPHHQFQPQQINSQHVFTAQSIPNLSLRTPNSPSTAQFPKPVDPHQALLYPVASSGRGFIPKSIRPKSPDLVVNVANPGVYPPRPVVYPHHVRAHLDPVGHQLHLMRHPYLHPSSTAGASSAAIKGIPVCGYPKVASSPSSIADDCNGHKSLRDRSRDDALTIVRDRKVRISDGSSLYAVCRSWLRNGFHEESQPQYGDAVKSLPRPLPMPTANTQPKKKEGEDDDDDNEEDEESVEQLSAKDLLKRHIKRSKRVRARLREERLQRIARYKTRLSLLLPSPVEPLKNDPAGN